MTFGSVAVQAMVQVSDDKRTAVLLFDTPISAGFGDNVTKANLTRVSLPDHLREAAHELVQIKGVDEIQIKPSGGQVNHVVLTINSTMAIPTAQEVLWLNGLLEFEQIIQEVP